MTRQKPFINRFRLRNLLIPQKLGLIAAIFFLIICILLFVSLFGMGVQSNVRAYVAGEGLWSKAQKEAVYALVRYVIFHNEEDYQRYSEYLHVPLGDRRALIELSKPDTDFRKVDLAFIDGRNHPEDVRGMGYLFKRFYFISYIRDAIVAWKAADHLLDELLHVGEEVRVYVQSEKTSNKQTMLFLERIDAINRQLAPLEDSFSYRLGEGARWLRNLLIWVMLGVTGVLLLFGILMAIFIARQLIREIYRLRSAAAKIAEGDYSQPIDIRATDEIGDLARSFHQMAVQRERAERAKDNFFATVSHELRTPLTLVLTPLESLLIGEYGPLSESERRILETMHNNAIRLLQMVTGLLDFSKFEAGRMEVKREPTDLVAVTRSIADDFSAMFSRKKIQMSLKFGQPSMLVLMDRYFYERILFNLLSNAVKFTPEEGSVSVSLECRENRLRLTVSDTGIGISSENQKYLFEKFKQLESASTRRFEGTGLGLALLKEFSELLGGRVTVQSATGQGSAFTVECDAPSADMKIEDLSEIIRPKRSAIQQYSAGSEMLLKPAASKNRNLPKLLIAEDNPELAAYLAEQIQEVAQVKIAQDGEAALEEAKKWLPDLVLSDVMMPKRDGLSLCRAIKSDSNLSDVPVILLTALTHREALLKGWEAGADEYLFKPFHPTELMTRIRSVLENRRQRQKTQAALRASHDQLEMKVRERTEELLVANERLKELDQMKTQFILTASHELRTPLTSIKGYVEMVLEGEAGALNDEQKEFLGYAKGSADRLQRLLQELLDISKIESTGMSVGRELTDLKSLIKEEHASFQPQAQKKNISIFAEFDPELKSIYCDSDKIREVFDNLLSNAIKFTPTSGEIKVFAKNHGEGILIGVQDNGIGIKKEYHRRIFEPFEHLGKHGTDPFEESTGLGLTLVEKIVKAHGGQIQVQSEEGKGSLFTVILPFDMRQKGLPQPKVQT